MIDLQIATPDKAVTNGKEWIYPNQDSLFAAGFSHRENSLLYKGEVVRGWSIQPLPRNQEHAEVTLCPVQDYPLVMLVWNPEVEGYRIQYTMKWGKEELLAFIQAEVPGYVTPVMKRVSESEYKRKRILEYFEKQHDAIAHAPGWRHVGESKYRELILQMDDILEG